MVAVSNGNSAFVYGKAVIRNRQASFRHSERDIWNTRSYFRTNGKGTPLVQGKRKKSTDSRSGLGAGPSLPLVIGKARCGSGLRARYGHEHNPIGRASRSRRVFRENGSLRYFGHARLDVLRCLGTLEKLEWRSEQSCSGFLARPDHPAAQSSERFCVVERQRQSTACGSRECLSKYREGVGVA